MAITEDVIDFEHEQILVIGSKGRPPRLVPINATAAAMLKEMIADGHLPFPVNDFRKRWHTALRDAGINKKGGTRKRIITSTICELLRKRANQEKHESVDIQNLFAHSDMSITTI